MRKLAERLEVEVPEAKFIFDQVREEKITPEEGLGKISQLIMVRPDIAEKMQVVLEPQKALPEPADSDIESALEKVPEHSNEALAQMGMTVEGLFYRDEVDGKVKLNPMYQTAVMERLQYDGDVPELRMGGDLPRGQQAAVPVEHEGVSPVALGAKLQQASDEVTKEIEDLRTEREENADLALAEVAAASLGENSETRALAVTEAQNALVELHQPLNVPGYEGGRKAAVRKVEGPTGAEIAQMPEAQKREFAYKAVSTTQGRRSSVPAIGRLVEQTLERAGYTVTVLQTWTKRPSLAAADWTMTLNIGPDDTSPNFSPIMVAGSSIGAKLTRTLRDGSVSPETEIDVEIVPINDYGERVVGWKAQALMSKTVPQLEAP